MEGAWGSDSNTRTQDPNNERTPQGRSRHEIIYQTKIFREETTYSIGRDRPTQTVYRSSAHIFVVSCCPNEAVSPSRLLIEIFNTISSGSPNLTALRVLIAHKPLGDRAQASSIVAYNLLSYTFDRPEHMLMSEWRLIERLIIEHPLPALHSQHSPPSSYHSIPSPPPPPPSSGSPQPESADQVLAPSSSAHNFQPMDPQAPG